MNTPWASLPYIERYTSSVRKTLSILGAGGAATLEKQSNSVSIQRLACTLQTRCRERCGKMSTGITSKKIAMAIRSTVTAQLDIWAVFGFGSFYRGQPFNDIDLLVVASPCCSTYLEAYYEVRKSFAAALQWLEA